MVITSLLESNGNVFTVFLNVLTYAFIISNPFVENIFETRSIRKFSNFVSKLGLENIGVSLKTTREKERRKNISIYNRWIVVCLSVTKLEG